MNLLKLHELLQTSDLWQQNHSPSAIVLAKLFSIQSMYVGFHSIIEAWDAQSVWNKLFFGKLTWYPLRCLLSCLKENMTSHRAPRSGKGPSHITSPQERHKRHVGPFKDHKHPQVSLQYTTNLVGIYPTGWHRPPAPSRIHHQQHVSHRRV